MKKTIFTLLLLSSSLLAFSQGSWTSRDTLPHDTNAMQQGISGFSIGNYGYVGLGNNNNGKYPIDLWQFNPSTNSWTIKAAFPGKARVAPACFVIGHYAYLVCGSVSNGGTCLTECWQYNANTNIWTQKANFPGGARTYAVGFAIGGMGYVGTGADELSDFYKDFYAYDTATNTWTVIADFGGIARDADCGFGVNGKGYLCFGRDSTGKVYNDMWEYNPGTNIWTQKTDNPYPTNAAVGFVICNNIYLGNGDSTDGFHGYTGFWKYNTVSDLWIREANFPGTITIQGAAFSMGDTGYCGFGADSTAAIENSFYRFYGGDSCNIVAGVTQINTDFKVNIYPNPFKDECHIELQDENTDTPLFSLYDVNGRKVDADIKPLNSASYAIKRNRLSQGVYILSVIYKNQVFHKKLIIIN